MRRSGKGFTDGIPPGLISTIDVRTELGRRMSLLEERDRTRPVPLVRAATGRRRHREADPHVSPPLLPAPRFRDPQDRRSRRAGSAPPDQTRSATQLVDLHERTKERRNTWTLLTGSDGFIKEEVVLDADASLDDDAPLLEGILDSWP